MVLSTTSFWASVTKTLMTCFIGTEKFNKRPMFLTIMVSLLLTYFYKRERVQSLVSRVPFTLQKNAYCLHRLAYLQINKPLQVQNEKRPLLLYKIAFYEVYPYNPNLLILSY